MDIGLHSQLLNEQKTVHIQAKMFVYVKPSTVLLFSMKLCYERNRIQGACFVGFFNLPEKLVALLGSVTIVWYPCVSINMCIAILCLKVKCKQVYEWSIYVCWKHRIQASYYVNTKNNSKIDFSYYSNYWLWYLDSCII